MQKYCPLTRVSRHKFSCHKFGRHKVNRHKIVFSMVFFSLAAIGLPVYATIEADCGGAGKLTNCKDKNINANTAGYVNTAPVNFTGNSTVTISAGNAFNRAAGDYHFRDKTQVNIEAEKGINSTATYQLRASTGVDDARVMLNIKAKQGLSQAKLLAQEKSNAIVNIEATHGIHGGSQTFNKNTTLNINAAEGLFASTAFTAASATINLNATDALTDLSTIEDPKTKKPKQLSIKNDSVLKVNSRAALSGGRIVFQDNSEIHANATGGITGGELLFNRNSNTVLSANATEAITGADSDSKQIFQAGTLMQINAVKGLNGGTQIFNSATLTVNAQQGIAGGYQTLAETSVLNALAAQAIMGGRMQFKDNAVFNAANNRTITGGNQNFSDNSILNADGGNTLSAGNQNFKGHSVLNANSAGSITGESRQVFSDSASVNINISDAINAGSQTIFKDNARADINAAQGISGGNLLFDGNSVLSANSENSISGGTLRLKGNAILHVRHEDALTNIAGALLFTESSTLNADVTHAISGAVDNNNKYVFSPGSTMNINASSALNGASQTFNDATLNVNADEGISAGYQIMAGNSVLNALADKAITGGQIKFQDNAVLNARYSNAISGGRQNFFNNAVLQAYGGNTLSGGNQNFHDNSIVNGNSPGTITGNSQQIFSGNAVLNANVMNTINGGSATTFKDHAQLNLNASWAVNAGQLLFDGNSRLNINAQNAITDTVLRFKGNTIVNLNHENALPDITLKPQGNTHIILNSAGALNHTNHIVFTHSDDTTDGNALDVNGYSLELGSISADSDKAKIINSGKKNAVLTSGLYHYGIAAGQHYPYPQFLQNRVMRADGVVASALADINRNAGLTLLAKFSDRAIPQASSLVEQGQGIWLSTHIIQNSSRGQGTSHGAWQSKTRDILLGADLFPLINDDNNKLGFYLGFLSGNADIDGKLLYNPQAQGSAGRYHFKTYAAAVYWRYLVSAGWYMNTTLQMNRYQGQAQSINSQSKPGIHGHGHIISFETGYPLQLSESLTLMPRLSITGQTQKMRHYQFDDLAVQTVPDKQMVINAGTRIYWQNTTFSGTQWLPWLDVEINNALAARDKNKLRIISRDHTEQPLTSWQRTQIKLTGGITVQLNNNVNYYINLGYASVLHDAKGNLWSGAMGINMNW